MESNRGTLALESRADLGGALSLRLAEGKDLDDSEERAELRPPTAGVLGAPNAELDLVEHHRRNGDVAYQRPDAP